MTSSRRPLLEAETTKPILDIFRDVHRTFGFGYREHIYRLAIEKDLRRLGHLVEREVGVIVSTAESRSRDKRLDMVVDNRVVIEIKATEQLHPSASAQLFSYLCSTDYEVGLLLHFGHKAEFQRVIFENRLKARRGRA